MLHGQDLLALVVGDVQRRDGSMRPVIEVARARGMPPVRCAYIPIRGIQRNIAELAEGQAICLTAFIARVAALMNNHCVDLIEHGGLPIDAVGDERCSDVTGNVGKHAGGNFMTRKSMVRRFLLSTWSTAQVGQCSARYGPGRRDRRSQGDDRRAICSGNGLHGIWGGSDQHSEFCTAVSAARCRTELRCRCRPKPPRWRNEIAALEHQPTTAAVFNLDQPQSDGIRLDRGSGVYLDKPPFNARVRPLFETPVTIPCGAGPNGGMVRAFRVFL